MGAGYLVRICANSTLDAKIYYCRFPNSDPNPTLARKPRPHRECSQKLNSFHIVLGDFDCASRLVTHTGLCLCHVHCGETHEALQRITTKVCSVVTTLIAHVLECPCLLTAAMGWWWVGSQGVKPRVISRVTFHCWVLEGDRVNVGVISPTSSNYVKRRTTSLCCAAAGWGVGFENFLAHPLVVSDSSF